jgi:hypothetical protein
MSRNFRGESGGFTWLCSDKKAMGFGETPVDAYKSYEGFLAAFVYWADYYRRPAYRLEELVKVSYSSGTGA